MAGGTKPEGPTDNVVSGKKELEDMEQHDSAGIDTANPVLDARIQAQIGRQLSDYYSKLVKEPIPGTFLELLSKLEKSEKGS